MSTMYVDKCTTKTGSKTYFRALIRETFREGGKIKHRTISNISKCSPELIALIDKALKNKGNLVGLVPEEGEIVVDQGLSVGAVLALYQVAQQLGIVKALGSSDMAKLSLWMVIARLIEPGSKLANVRLAQAHAAVDVLGLKSFNEDNLYEALDWLATKQKLIEKRMFKHRHPENTNTFFLYDVTSSYLEGTKNELALFGYNRDKKKGKMQIVIGLLTDSEGWPVSIEVFTGNTQDPKSVASQVKKLASQFGCKHVALVGDRGMIKSKQVKEINDKNFHYITAITTRQIKTLRKQGTIQVELFTNELCEVEKDGIRYILRKNPVRAREIKEVRKSKEKKIQDMIEDRNQYLIDHPKASPSVAKANVMKWIKKLKLSNYLSVIYRKRNLILECYNEDLDELSLLDGCYVLKTDIPQAELCTELVHKGYKSLARVEEAFRTMKLVLLEIRPLFLRNEMRTRAHVFTVMLSYYMAKHLRIKWRELDMTVKEGIHELSSLCVTTVQVGAMKYNKIPNPRVSLGKLLDALDVKVPPVIPCSGIVVATRKKIDLKRKKK